jgi:hypothetical protein
MCYIMFISGIATFSVNRLPNLCHICHLLGISANLFYKLEATLQKVILIIYLVQVRFQRRAFVNTVMNTWVI